MDKSRFHLDGKRVVMHSRAPRFYSISPNTKIFWKRNRIPEAVYISEEKTLFVQEGREHFVNEQVSFFDIKKRVYFRSQADLENYFQPSDREFLSRR